MGKFSRAKGSREERALVQHLKDLKYENVKRVPLSGAAAGFKFDVLATDKGREYSFELKTRRELFKWVYAFIELLPAPEPDDRAFRFTDGEGYFSISYDPRAALKVGLDHPFYSATDKSFLKTLKRIGNLKKLKGEADFLVIKINNKHRIFIKYF